MLKMYTDDELKIWLACLIAMPDPHDKNVKMEMEWYCFEDSETLFNHVMQAKKEGFNIDSEFLFVLPPATTYANHMPLIDFLDEHGGVDVDKW